MIPISVENTAAVLPPVSTTKAVEASKARRPEEDVQSRPRRPVTDEYILGEKPEPSGRYCLGHDKGGQPKICFDDPEQAADAPKKPKDAPNTEKPRHNKEAKGPEKSDKQEDRCIGDTGSVDREIERLKKKRRELEQQLNTETDEVEIKELKRQLAQVEQALRQKDNDTYRKRHTTFTRLS